MQVTGGALLLRCWHQRSICIHAVWKEVLCGSVLCSSDTLVTTLTVHDAHDLHQVLHLTRQYLLDTIKRSCARGCLRPSCNISSSVSCYPSCYFHLEADTSRRRRLLTMTSKCQVPCKVSTKKTITMLWNWKLLVVEIAVCSKLKTAITSCSLPWSAQGIGYEFSTCPHNAQNLQI